MAKLVLGTDINNTGTASFVRDVGPAHYIEKTVDASGKLQSSTKIINLNGVTDVGYYALSRTYSGVIFPANTNIDLSSLTILSGEGACNSMFNSCTNLTSIDFPSLTTISGSNACYYMFSYCSGLTSVDLPSLTTISDHQACYGMFYSCPNLTSIDFPSLTTISGSNACYYMFNDCSGLTSVDLSSLTTISGSNACCGMFYGCTNLTSIDFSSLTTISGDGACNAMFYFCYSLTSIDFPSLTTIEKQLSPSYAPVFAYCKHLESVKFGGLKSTTFASAVNQLQYLFYVNTGSEAPNGCTVHFPSNFDPSDPNHTFDASTLAGYPTFGGNASYIKIAFDLPATES